MSTSEHPIPLVRVADLAREGRPTQPLIRAARTGAQRRIFRGAYTPTTAWSDASDRQQHLARMRAAAASRMAHPVVFTHESAALVWGIPILGRWPADVHLRAFGRLGARSGAGIVWHRGALTGDDVCEVGGLLVTSFVRTLVDLARATSFASAVASLDYGTKTHLLLPDGGPLGGIECGVLVDRLNQDGAARGIRSARAALAFCNPLSGSVGESYSRVQMHRLRFRPPRLQVAVARRDGLGTDYPDFDWPEGYGEFDGKIKYTRDQYMSGRSIEEIVWAEKRREDRLRRAGNKNLARWLWDDVNHPSRLRDILLDAGLMPLSEAQYRRECDLVTK